MCQCQERCVKNDFDTYKTKQNQDTANCIHCFELKMVSCNDLEFAVTEQHRSGKAVFTKVKKYWLLRPLLHVSKVYSLQRAHYTREFYVNRPLA